MKWYTKHFENELVKRIRIPVSWFNVGFRKQHYTKFINMIYSSYSGYLLRGNILGTKYFYLYMHEKGDDKIYEDLRSENMSISNARAVIRTKIRLGEITDYDLWRKYTDLKNEYYKCKKEGTLTDTLEKEFRHYERLQIESIKD